MDGKELKAIRKHLGMTQQRFADEMDLSREFVGQMERGQEPISKATRALALSLVAPDIYALSKQVSEATGRPSYLVQDGHLVSVATCTDARMFWQYGVMVPKLEYHWRVMSCAVHRLIQWMNEDRREAA